MGIFPFEKDPFNISVFCGNSKPHSPNQYLHDFVEEVSTPEQGFTVAERMFHLSLDCFIYDAPAQAFIKQTKGHGGYSGCDHCIQEEFYVGRKMTFPETHATRRTDESFEELLDENHHRGHSKLSTLSLGMVTQFVLDYIYVVCLGVTRKMHKFWIKGDLKYRLSSPKISTISEKLLGMSQYIRCEFAQRPRPLSELDR